MPEKETIFSSKIKSTGIFSFKDFYKFCYDWLREVEINQGGAKVKTNQGSVETEIKGILVRDYEGKFETSAFKKFLRGIYEKWVIPSAIEEYKGKISESCDKFLNQAKAYLDLEGKKM